MCLDCLVCAVGVCRDVAGVGLDAELVEFVEALEELVFVGVVELGKRLLVRLEDQNVWKQPRALMLRHFSAKNLARLIRVADLAVHVAHLRVFRLRSVNHPLPE